MRLEPEIATESAVLAGNPSRIDWNVKQIRAGLPGGK